MRRVAKAVNFGVIYGQGDNGLAKALGIARAEASNFIAAYFRRLIRAQAAGDFEALRERDRRIVRINLEELTR